MADIFISYTSSDRDWAFWIAKELEALRHTAHVHEWEIKGGGDIMAWMVERHDKADFILGVVSDDWLRAAYSKVERMAGEWAAAHKRPGFMLYVVVRPATLPTIGDHRKRIEIFGVPDSVKRQRLKDYLASATRPAVPDGSPDPIFAVSNIPIRVPEHFLGREDSLAAIETALNRHEGRVAITTLHGLRGVGKTTLAAAYADRHHANYRATWWIRAQTETTMRADLVGLGVRLGWVTAEEKEEPALAAVMERLRHEGEGILLIYDNAINADALWPYLPRGGAVRVLVTSNTHAWRGVAAPVEIRLWPKEIGADYLIARTGRDEERAAAEVLSEALGGLPLAHEQAAAYCERLGISLADYSKRFAAAPARMLDAEHDAPAEYHDRLTVAKTFALAIDEAAKLHPAAELLITYAALLAPEPIPLFLFDKSREKFGDPLASALAGDGLDEAVATLRAFAMVDRESIVDERNPAIATDSIRLHRLVRQVAASRLKADVRDEMLGVLIEAVAALYSPEVWRDPESWPRARRLDVLVEALVGGNTEPPQHAEKRAADVLVFAGQYRHNALAAYGRARPLFERALAIREKVLGPEHPDTAMSLIDLAVLLRAQGDLAGARLLYDRALAIDEKVLGPEHPDTAMSLNNLAVLLEEQGDLPTAQQLYERALSIREKVLGPEHPNTATTLNNLANLMRARGDIAGARPLSDRALSIREKVLGPEHPHTATSLNNLALLLQAQGDLAGARSLQERDLAISEKVLGPNHPETATSLNNLAVLRQEQGDLAGARPLYERALSIYDKVLGRDHPRTKDSARNTAAALDMLRRSDEAAALRERYGIADGD